MAANNNIIKNQYANSNNPSIEKEQLNISLGQPLSTEYDHKIDKNLNSKSHSLSIYLLKNGFDHKNSIDNSSQDNKLIHIDASNTLPQGTEIYIQKRYIPTVWWSKYLDIRDKSLFTNTTGALMFLPVKDHCFLFSFGYAFHKIIPSVYEEHFGLLITLNTIDKNNIRGIDWHAIDKGINFRAQTAKGSNIGDFDLEKDSTILIGLAGKSTEKYRDYFSNINGSDKLLITTKYMSQDLPKLCDLLLKKYKSQDYKNYFPNIFSGTEEKDKDVIANLEIQLLEHLQNAALNPGKDVNIYLGIPEITDYGDNHGIMYGGSLKIYSELSIDSFAEYLKSKLTKFDIETIKRIPYYVVDENGAKRSKKYLLYNSIIFNTSIIPAQKNYYIAFGKWHKINEQDMQRIADKLDSAYKKDINLPDLIKGEKEDEYIKRATRNNTSLYLCHGDNIAKNIPGYGRGNIEPCDIFGWDSKESTLYHIKRYNHSQHLSHLFNQGLNSSIILKSFKEARLEFIKQLKENKNIPDINENKILKAKVVFVIPIKNNKDNKSNNIPFFSKFSLYRCLHYFDAINISVYYSFINIKKVINDHKLMDQHQNIDNKLQNNYD